MKKGLVTTIVIAVVALGIFSWVKSTIQWYGGRRRKSKVCMVAG